MTEKDVEMKDVSAKPSEDKKEQVEPADPFYGKFILINHSCRIQKGDGYAWKGRQGERFQACFLINQIIEEAQKESLALRCGPHHVSLLAWAL